MSLVLIPTVTPTVTPTPPLITLTPTFTITSTPTPPACACTSLIVKKIGSIENNPETLALGDWVTLTCYVENAAWVEFSVTLEDSTRSRAVFSTFLGRENSPFGFGTTKYKIELDGLYHFDCRGCWNDNSFDCTSWPGGAL
jgi:hypothetical protein